MTNQNFDFESYATNFLSANVAELIRFSQEHEFSFSEKELIYIQSHFINQKRALPTYNQLNFFNHIALIRKHKKTDYSVDIVSAADEDASIIMQTAKDLLKKKNLCQARLFDAMPLSYAAKTASEYLRYLDCAQNTRFFAPASCADSQSYYIHTDGKPLFSLLNTNAVVREKEEFSVIGEKSVIAILSPNYELSTEEYEKQATEFFNSPDVKAYVSEYKAVNGDFGLLDFLIKENQGVSLNLSKIPEAKKDESGKAFDLTDILYACRGRYIFDINPLNSASLSRLAEEYKLSVNVFATRNYSNLFTLYGESNPAFCFKFDFLSELMSFKEARKYIFTGESSMPIGNKNPIFLTDGKSEPNRTYSAEKLLIFTKNIATATSRNARSAPFKTAAFAVLDAITALVAKGVSKNSISLSIHYTLLSGTDDPTELGKNFATILGAYRTMIELCISDYEPQISYSDTKRSITVVASAKPSPRKLKSVFTKEETFVYFLPVQYDSYGNPDYQKYRYLIKYFSILLEKNAVLSAFAINENFSTIISSANQDNSFEYSEKFDAGVTELKRGIVFETVKELPLDNSIFLIGKKLPTPEIKEENSSM